MSALPFRRVLSLQPSITAILDRLGRRSVLVGVTRWCADVAEVEGLPRVGDSWSIRAAEITPLAPDLVLASVPYSPSAIAEILSCGAAFIGFAPHTLADVFRDIAALGILFDARPRAAEIIAEMQTEIAQVRARVAGQPRIRTYCEEWGKPLMVSTGWTRELVEAAGGEFLFAPGARPQPQEVAEQCPEALIFSWCGAGDRVPVARLLERRNWNHLPAARAGRVATISDECLNTPAPTLLAGLRALAAVLHPECCADLAPAGKLRRYSPPRSA